MSFDTALVSTIQTILNAAGYSAPSVYWRDGSSAWRAEQSCALSWVSRVGIGKDVRTLGDVDPGTLDAPETIRGNRVWRVQATFDANARDVALDMAEAVKAGLQSSMAEAAMWSENVSAPRPADVRQVNYRDEHRDVRSAAILDIVFNATSKLTIGRVPVLQAAEITGSVTPGPIATGPGLIER